MARYCNQCNYPIEDGNNFCSECGSNDIRDTNVPEKDSISPAEIVNTEATIPQPETVPLIQNDMNSSINNSNQDDVGSFSLGKIETTQNSFADIPENMKEQNDSISSTPQPVYNNQIVPQGEATMEVIEQSKKTSKVFLIVGIVVGVFVTILLLLFILGNTQNKAAIPSNVDKFTESDMVITDNPTGNTFDYSTIFTPQNSYRVGSEEHGFISIPNTWKQYIGDQDDHALHYTDDVEWMVSLDSIKTTEYRAYEYANEILDAIVSNGGENVATSKTIIGGYPTLSIYAYYPKQKKHLSTWFLESKNGYTHYLAIEGPSANSDNYNIIYSFSEKK